MYGQGMDQRLLMRLMKKLRGFGYCSVHFEKCFPTGVSKMQGNLQVHVPASSQQCLRALEVESQIKWKGKRRSRKVRQREKRAKQQVMLGM